MELPHGAVMPLMPGRAPPFVRRQKEAKTPFHALDEGTGVTRAWETGVQNSKELGKNRLLRARRKNGVTRAWDADIQLSAPLNHHLHKK